ncbi:hypothetical protein JTE90_025313 [Oedothorax gibbosus]|uniref:Uncharacterized protein n=1 Tax=Oedothorax gibbosus TaxID=931172 RepID=A0AAV6V769_9ARAC|nr:hypothetical protein JTE90_025313 [Oedothorax gibbosus]
MQFLPAHATPTVTQEHNTENTAKRSLEKNKIKQLDSYSMSTNNNRCIGFTFGTCRLVFYISSCHSGPDEQLVKKEKPELTVKRRFSWWRLARPAACGFARIDWRLFFSGFSLRGCDEDYEH